MTMQVIQHIELGSAQSTITFSSIPQTATDLYLLFSARGSSASDAFLSLNGSSANLTRRDLWGNGTATGSSNATDGYVGNIGNPSYTANTFSSTSLYIPNYTASTAKSVSIEAVNENNGTDGFQRVIALLWNNTAAITSLTLTPAAGNFVAGSSATLYGITKGSDGTTTVS